MVDASKPPEPVHIQVLFSELEPLAQKKIHAVFRKLLSDLWNLEDQNRFEQMAMKLKSHVERSTKSTGWSCIIGSSFSASFAFDHLVHHFMIDGHAVLLFQTK